MKIEISNIYDSGRRTVTVGSVKIPWPFPIAYSLGGSSARVFGYPVYGHNAPAYVKAGHRFFYGLRGINLWLQYRLIKKQKCHVIYTDLEPGYYDIDTIMLHGCMTLLCRYIEDEMGGVAQIEKFNAELAAPGSEGRGPREATDHQHHTQKSALDIYRWWKVERPANQKRHNELLMRLYGGRSRVRWVATENPHLTEMQFTPFEGDEVAQHAEMHALEAKIKDDEQSMLHALINIRQSLWT